MFEKLKEIEKRYDEINELLTDPAVIADNEKYKSLMREYKKLTPLMEKFRECEKAQNAFDEAKQLLDEGGLDKDFKEMVQQEYDESKAAAEALGEDL